MYVCIQRYSPVSGPPLQQYRVVVFGEISTAPQFPMPPLGNFGTDTRSSYSIAMLRILLNGDMALEVCIFCTVVLTNTERGILASRSEWNDTHRRKHTHTHTRLVICQPVSAVNDYIFTYTHTYTQTPLCISHTHIHTVSQKLLTHVALLLAVGRIESISERTDGRTIRQDGLLGAQLRARGGVSRPLQVGAT